MGEWHQQEEARVPCDRGGQNHNWERGGGVVDNDGTAIDESQDTMVNRVIIFQVDSVEGNGIAGVLVQ